MQCESRDMYTACCTEYVKVYKCNIKYGTHLPVLNICIGVIDWLNSYDEIVKCEYLKWYLLNISLYLPWRISGFLSVFDDRRSCSELLCWQLLCVDQVYQTGKVTSELDNNHSQESSHGWYRGRKEPGSHWVQMKPGNPPNTKSSQRDWIGTFSPRNNTMGRVM